MLKLIFPTPDYAEQVMSYKKEFLDHDEEMAGVGSLRRCETFEDWLRSCTDNLTEETVGPRLVPATLFLAVDENDRLVGMIDVRHRLNEHLVQFGGNIGYSVHPDFRRRGYASEMLALALKEAKKLGLEKAFVTCDSKNIASARTIQKNGGVLENEVPDEGRITKRYWIEVK